MPDAAKPVLQTNHSNEVVPGTSSSLTAPVSKPDRAPRIAGVDTLRLILASWVVVGHTAPIPIREILLRVHSPKVVVGIGESLFNGAAAVMAFFVISGFCIHTSFLNGQSISLRSYLIRREIRIVPPALALYLLGMVTGNYEFLTGLWSLICEEIYYLLYPFFRPFIAARGFKTLFLGSLFGWVGVLIMPKHHELIWSKGWTLTWLLCSSVWIIGAMLAEAAANGKRLLDWVPWAKKEQHIWSWRIGIILASLACTGFEYIHVTSQLVLIPFGLLSCFWVEQEIIFFRLHPPKPIFESLGKGSYSLYLSHPVLIAVARNYKATHSAYNSRVYDHFLPLQIWIPLMFGIAGFAALVYFAIELPSHNLARKLGRRFA